MESASMPSASAIAMAAPTIRSTVIPGFRPRLGAGLVPHSNASVSSDTAPPPKLAACSSEVVMVGPILGVLFMRMLYP
jgi:hypothetical protein